MDFSRKWNSYGKDVFFNRRQRFSFITDHRQFALRMIPFSFQDEDVRECTFHPQTALRSDIEEISRPKIRAWHSVQGIPLMWVFSSLVHHNNFARLHCLKNQGSQCSTTCSGRAGSYLWSHGPRESACLRVKFLDIEGSKQIDLACLQQLPIPVCSMWNHRILRTWCLQYSCIPSLSYPFLRSELSSITIIDYLTKNKRVHRQPRSQAV